MKIIGPMTLVPVALLALCAASAWSQGVLLCETPDTGGGCGTPVGIQHPGFGLEGGISFEGLEFDGGGIATGQPPLRFWAADKFDARNSGDALRVLSGTEWMANSATDFSLAVAPEIWFIYQANWANAGVEGCISTSPADTRNVAEISYCDVDDSTWFMVASVTDPSTAFFSYDSITGALPGTGGGLNLIPMTKLEPLTPTTFLAADMFGFGTITLDTSAITLPTYTEMGLDVMSHVAGIEVTYVHGTLTSGPIGCSTRGTPVLDPRSPLSPLGPVAVGGTLDVTVPTPGSTLSAATYFSYRVVYADAASPCGAGDECLVTGTPVSCDAEFSSGVPWAVIGVAVEFDNAGARRVSNGVVIEWTTASELGTAAFEVSRSASRDGAYEQVARVFLRTDRTYSVLDRNASSSTAFYTITEVLVPGEPGSPSVAGPFQVGPVGGSRSRRRASR